MSAPTTRSSEFRRYRQGLQLFAFGGTAIIVAWLIASVAHTLFTHPAVHTGAAFSGRADDVDALLTCQADVETLFDTSHRKLVELLGTETPASPAPTAGAQRAGGGRDRAWEAFSVAWRQRYAEVGARCRFDELRAMGQKQGLGAAYDRLAAAYGELEEEHRNEAALLDHYVDHHASRVDAIRTDLTASRKALEAERAARGGSHAG